MTIDLIEAARAGAPQDVERLIEAAWPHAFRIARSILHDHALAEDAAQDACASVYLAIPTLRSADAFSVWFYRIVVRAAWAIERRRPPLAVIEPSVDETRDFDRSVMRLDVLSALARLSAAQRTAIVLHYYAGLNSREIAAVLRIPDSSVRFHLMRAKRVLERLLSDRDVTHGTLREVVAGAV
jgi:RNA polymerase sigma-70 factor, ECF subfamily